MQGRSLENAVDGPFHFAGYNIDAPLFADHEQSGLEREALQFEVAGALQRGGKVVARFRGSHFRQMLPAFTSHIIAAITLAIPGMILSETALSFLGLGLREPVVSWGVLLQDAQDIRSIAGAPWLLTPALAVVVSVLALNFLGDGLRDAADPYAR